MYKTIMFYFAIIARPANCLLSSAIGCDIWKAFALIRTNAADVFEVDRVANSASGSIRI